MALVMTIGLVLGYAWSVVLLHRQARYGLQPGTGSMPAARNVTPLRPGADARARGPVVTDMRRRA